MKRLPTLSQNFLRNPITVKRLIGHTNIRRTDTVYDIGAGSGVVASALATVAKTVIAIEVDGRLIPTLRANLKHAPNVSVEHGDILHMPLPQTPYKVFANIPFNLSAAIVQRLTQAAHPPVAIYLIVQEQFARKFLADGKSFTSQLGVMTAVGFAARIRYRLKPADYYPRPNVPTVLLELLLRPIPLLSPAQRVAFADFVATSFTQPQRFWKLPLERYGIAPKTSPSRLTLAQWVQLFTAQNDTLDTA